MKTIKQCKQDQQALKEFDRRLQALIKDVSEQGADFQSRYQQSDDEELAVVQELYISLCGELKSVRKSTDISSRLSTTLASRLTRLKSMRPTLWQKLFSRKRLNAAKGVA
tara:strand:+ start:592 stop:921 length:330 start_codon:yes stop_codon:yes gene_type:complete